MRVLITGQNSYIGINLKEWLRKTEGCQVETISLRDQDWTKMNFSRFDAVIHLAAIVHEEKFDDRDAYMSVNRDMAIRVAEKARMEGVKQFIFFSTMAVYGLTGNMKRPVIIDKNTTCKPNTPYAMSKYAAEEALIKLQDDNFAVAIIRAPIVFGSNCRGNYARLRVVATKALIFPKVNNKRSMLYIGNLCELVRLILDSGQGGYFFPQDSEYYNTTELVKKIRSHQGKPFLASRFLGCFVFVLGFLGLTSKINKAFGSLVYARDISNHFDGRYLVYNQEETVKLTEENWKSGS